MPGMASRVEVASQMVSPGTGLKFRGLFGRRQLDWMVQ
jgi:hypothetical protein